MPEAVTAPAVVGALARWAAGTDFDTLPRDAVWAAKRALIDYLGVALAGSDHPLAARLQSYLDAQHCTGSCGLIGRAGRASFESAVLFNAAIGHVLDFDDTCEGLGGHPSVVLLPGLLALAEVRPVTGRELILSYCVGYEVLAELGRRVNFEHYNRGWHPTATLGVVGSAVACAKLIGLSAERTAAALAVALSFSAGLKVNFGTDMKAVQVARGAQGGVIAAQMAAAGISGSPEAFEGRRGFGEVYNGPGQFRDEPVAPSFPLPWSLVDPGPVIKQYPCCGSTHSAVDAARGVSAALGTADGIERVVVRLHPNRLAHTNRPSPRTPLDAKFSVQFVTALALSRGNVVLSDFEEDSLRDPKVLSLADRVSAEPLPADRLGPEQFAAETEVWTRGGRHEFARVEKAKGRGAGLALTDAEVTGKFSNCADRVIGAASVKQLLADAFRLEDLQNVGQLMGQVVGVPSSSRRPSPAGKVSLCPTAG